MIAGGATDVKINEAKTNHCNSGSADWKNKCEVAVSGYANQYPEDENLVVADAIGYSCYTDQWKGVKERPAECLAKSLGRLDQIKQGQSHEGKFTKAGTTQQLPIRPVDFNRGGVTGIAADTPAAAVLAQIKAKAEAEAKAKAEAEAKAKAEETGWKNEPVQLKAKAGFSVGTLDDISNGAEVSADYQVLKFGTPFKENAKPPHSFDLHIAYSNPTIQSFLLGSNSAYIREHPTLFTSELEAYPHVTFRKETERKVEGESEPRVDTNSLNVAFGLKNNTANDTAIDLAVTAKHERAGLGEIGITGHFAPCATANMFDPDPELPQPPSDRFCRDGVAYGGKAFAKVAYEEDDKKKVFKGVSLKGDISYITAGQDAAPGTDKANLRWNVGAEVTLNILQGLTISAGLGHRTRILNDLAETEDYRYVPEGGIDLSITERLTLKTALASWKGAAGADYAVLGGGYGTGACTTYEGEPCSLSYETGGDTLVAGAKASYTLFTFASEGGLDFNFDVNGGLDYLDQSSVYDPSQDRSLWIGMVGGGFNVRPTKPK